MVVKNTVLKTGNFIVPYLEYTYLLLSYSIGKKLFKTG